MITVPLEGLSEEELLDVSRRGQLSLNLPELRAIKTHFAEVGRDPTDVELETLAQTWSEHCSHKTLKGRIAFETADNNGRPIHRFYDNLLKQTIFAATVKIAPNWAPMTGASASSRTMPALSSSTISCDVCFKVETHNHPSAIEPYGGANTGIGGVIRDPLGTGLGAKPVCNTDVFCFAPPDTPARVVAARRACIRRES